MKFYRRLNPLKAMSFDLDDTLYNNHPFIVEAEKQLFHFVFSRWPQVFAGHTSKKLSKVTCLSRFFCLHCNIEVKQNKRKANIPFMSKEGKGYPTQCFIVWYVHI